MPGAVDLDLRVILYEQIAHGDDCRATGADLDVGTGADVQAVAFDAHAIVLSARLRLDICIDLEVDIDVNRVRPAPERERSITFEANHRHLFCGVAVDIRIEGNTSLARVLFQVFVVDHVIANEVENVLLPTRGEGAQVNALRWSALHIVFVVGRMHVHVVERDVEAVCIERDNTATHGRGGKVKGLTGLHRTVAHEQDGLLLREVGDVEPRAPGSDLVAIDVRDDAIEVHLLEPALRGGPDQGIGRGGRAVQDLDPAFRVLLHPLVRDK